MTIHLYIQTEHICKGTVQRLTTLQRGGQWREGRELSQRDMVSQEDRLGSS